MQNGQRALEEFPWPAKAAADLGRGAHIVRFQNGSTIFHSNDTVALDILLSGGRLTAISEIAESFGLPNARCCLTTLRLSHEDFAALVGASRPMVSKGAHRAARAVAGAPVGGEPRGGTERQRGPVAGERIAAHGARRTLQVEAKGPVRSG
jgi:hypothetical protein